MSNNFKNVLVTGAGGIAGVNFIRAIKLESSLHIFGAEQNDLHKIYSENIEITDVPSPLETNYIEKLNDIITNLDISFLHPQPTPELQVIAKNRDNLEAKLFLPETSTILKDKSEQNKILHQNNISVTKTFDINTYSIGQNEFFRLQSTYLQNDMVYLGKIQAPLFAWSQSLKSLAQKAKIW